MTPKPPLPNASAIELLFARPPLSSAPGAPALSFFVSADNRQIYLTPDVGQTWKDYSLPPIGIATWTTTAMTYVNGIGIAGTKQGELFYLPATGSTWTPIGQSPTSGFPVLALEGDAYGTDLYVGVGGKVCHMTVPDVTSLDLAANQATCTFIGNGNVTSLALSGTNLAASTNVPGSVYLSTDKAASWQKLTADSNNPYFNVETQIGLGWGSAGLYSLSKDHLSNRQDLTTNGSWKSSVCCMNGTQELSFALPNYTSFAIRTILGDDQIMIGDGTNGALFRASGGVWQDVSFVKSVYSGSAANNVNKITVDQLAVVQNRFVAVGHDPQSPITASLVFRTISGF